MAINKNHEFEELNGIKCAIVEKNCNSERVNFLKELLEWNKYTVVVVESPAAKAAPGASATTATSVFTAAATTPSSASAAESAAALSGAGAAPNSVIDPTPDIPVPPPPPTTYTVGVTDLTFNPINAIFGRILKTKNNRIVTQAYWKQQVDFSNDEVPYFEMKKV